MRKSLFGLCSVWVAGAAVAGVDWPQFRGPHANGLSDAQDPPLHWSETNGVVWKTEPSGRGRSSPVLLGDKLWLTSARERGVQRTRIGPDDMQTAEHIELLAVCLSRRDGHVIWETRLGEVDRPDPVHWFNSWATPTPVVAADRLYCDFGTHGTFALESATGKLVWSRRLPLDHQVGPGSSPVLEGNRLILVRDGRDAQYVTALDAATGEPLWRTERPPLDAPQRELKKSFVTPLLVATGGRAQLLSPGAQWIVSYDPANGKEIWRLRHGPGFSIGSCPVFGGDVVFFSTGCFRPVFCAVRTDGQGDVTDSKLLWKSPRQVPVMSSPVLVGDEVYWVSDEGMATCTDARTGEVRWQERLGGGHLASPILAAGRLYFFAQDGKTTVLKAGTRFERLAENALPGPLVATPAIVDDGIFLRTDSAVYRIQ
jgi:outer membrane protein assembly factor BamB